MNYPRISSTFVVGLFVFGVLSFGGFKQADAVSPEKKESQPQKTSDIKATFVELGSVNCIPCKAMQPVMKEIEQEYGDQVKVIFHDVWTSEGKAYGKKYKVQAIPTQVFLDKNGKEYFRHLGYFPKEEVVKVLEKQGVKRTATEEKGSQQKQGAENKLPSGQICE